MHQRDTVMLFCIDSIRKKLTTITMLILELASHRTYSHYIMYHLTLTLFIGLSCFKTASFSFLIIISLKHRSHFTPFCH